MQNRLFKLMTSMSFFTRGLNQLFIYLEESMNIFLSLAIIFGFGILGGLLIEKIKLKNTSINFLLKNMEKIKEEEMTIIMSSQEQE